MSKATDRKIDKALDKIAELINRGKLPLAERQCLSLRSTYPDNPGVLFLLGNIRYFQRRWQEAAALLERSLELFPEEIECKKTLLATYIDSKQTDQAFKMVENLLPTLNDDALLIVIYNLFTNTCSWEKAEKIKQRTFKAILRRDPGIRAYLPAFLLYLNGLDHINQDLRFALHKTAEILAEDRSSGDLDPAQYIPKKRIKIAYLSPDFRRHPVSYFIYPVLCAHDKTQYEIYCYAHLVEKDGVTETISQVSDHFIDVTNYSNEELAKLIRHDGIQVLVDLAGHTQYSRLQTFGYRAAPVQITYLGYPSTTAFPEADFRITDRNAESIEGNRYTEELLYMPESFLCFGIHPECQRLDVAASRQTGHITFGAFCASHKINPDEIKIWSRILNRVPNAQLALKARWSSDVVRNHITHEFSKHGISEKRLVFLPVVTDYNGHLEHYNLIDIALDTFPYGGTTTTCEALIMGVPVVTLVGSLHAQRVSYSILKNIGFEETITHTSDEYIDKAVQLAGNANGLDILRKTLPLLLRGSITGQPQQFTRQLESLYDDACQRKGLDLSAVPNISDNKSCMVSTITRKPTVSNIAENPIENKKLYPPEFRSCPATNQPIPTCSTILTIDGKLSMLSPVRLQEMNNDLPEETVLWPDDEMCFFRKIILPGMKVLDASSDFGYLALCAAWNVRAEGSVLVIETDPEKRSLVNKGAVYNGFDWLKIIATRLSEEMVQDFSVNGIDIIILPKLHHPLSALLTTLEQHSPLLISKMSRNESRQSRIESTLSSLGYSAYRLIPGLNILAPVPANHTPSKYRRTIFYCTQTCSEQLASGGYLAIREVASVQLPEDSSHWTHIFYQRNYSKQRISDWKHHIFTQQALESTKLLCQIMSAYTLAHDPDESPEQRYGYLSAAASLLANVPGLYKDAPKLITYARISAELGYDEAAADALKIFVDLIKTDTHYSLKEPFLTVSEKYDQFTIRKPLVSWLRTQAESQIQSFQQPNTLSNLKSNSSFSIEKKRLWNISIVGGITVSVPDSVQLMTPYVLREQGDWFEEEIKFIRRLIQPGMQALDIGANYGVYTLTMAKLVGHSGDIWAFEPGSATADFLALSIKLNGFENVHLIRTALSNRTGNATLAIGANTELNAIIQGEAGTSANTETVTLTRLDDCLEINRWQNMDFVKMDAEGEEVRIIEGGTEFFQKFSPLVMFELEHVHQINEGLIQCFINLGYHPYLLIPGLSILVPFDPGGKIDGFQLNLFCCKDDRASILELSGLLCRNSIKERTLCPEGKQWQQFLQPLTYAQHLLPSWEEHWNNGSQLPESKTYQRILNTFALSHHPTTRACDRFNLLQSAFVHLGTLVNKHSSISRLFTLVRLAEEVGQRDTAICLLDDIINQLDEQQTFTPDEPFCAVSAQAEQSDPGDQIDNWCLAHALAQRERLGSFSSYFTGNSSLPCLERIRELGFEDRDISRRRSLIKQRFSEGLEVAP